MMLVIICIVSVAISLLLLLILGGVRVNLPQIRARRLPTWAIIVLSILVFIFFAEVVSAFVGAMTDKSGRPQKLAYVEGLRAGEQRSITIKAGVGVPSDSDAVFVQVPDKENYLNPRALEIWSCEEGFKYVSGRRLPSGQVVYDDIKDWEIGDNHVIITSPTSFVKVWVPRSSTSERDSHIWAYSRRVKG